ncbi:MAG: DUF4136 domain-containing protein, partial [bacterium]|nr:DUF4136 domain-containing protein [bacterium]
MKRFISSLLLVIMITTGCSSMKVMVDYDDQIDFGNYQTFTFVAPKKPSSEEMKRPAFVRDPLFIKKASREISAVLSKKGFVPAGEPKGADFLVAFYATAKDRVQITPPSYHIGRFGRRWIKPGRAHHYKQGTLVID